MALKSVSALVLDGLAIFEFGVICEVFGIDRCADGVPNFDFKVCGPEPAKPLRTSVGATITPHCGLDGLVGVDLVAIPAISSQYGGYLPEALDAVRKTADSGSIILTVCSGAFVAGAAGLLDGRPCTTHWMHADELARMYPTAKVDRNVLFVDDGNLITSAGTAAGIVACLHLVRRELGSEVTNKIARRMRAAPVHRPTHSGAMLGRICAALGLDPHQPRQAAYGRDASHSRAHVGAHLRPSVRRGNRSHPDAMGDRPAGALRASAAGGDRSRHRQDRRPIRFRHGHAAAPPLPQDHRRDAIGLPPPVRLRRSVRGGCRNGLAAGVLTLRNASR